MDKPEKSIQIRVLDVGDFVQVEIEDNGRGISAKDLPYIFDRFLQDRYIQKFFQRRKRHWTVNRSQDHGRPWWKSVGDQPGRIGNDHVFCA